MDKSLMDKSLVLNSANKTLHGKYVLILISKEAPDEVSEEQDALLPPSGVSDQELSKVV
jgi:hypothetical protein